MSPGRSANVIWRRRSEYIREVHTYIRKWQTSGRFVRAAKLAQDTGYTRAIVEELLKQSLAPQFFYLAMQESDFEPFRSGPPTRWGIAKGMWQFIPETGARYGLKIGPLAKPAVPDKDGRAAALGEGDGRRRPATSRTFTPPMPRHQGCW